MIDGFANTTNTHRKEKHSILGNVVLHLSNHQYNYIAYIETSLAQFKHAEEWPTATSPLARCFFGSNGVLSLGAVNSPQRKTPWKGGQKPKQGGQEQKSLDREKEEKKKKKKVRQKGTHLSPTAIFRTVAAFVTVPVSLQPP